MQAHYYQEWTRTTAIYPANTEAEALSYVILGFAGEVGEIANKYKKVLRDNGGVMTDQAREGLLAEVGDAGWYFFRLIDELGGRIERVLEANHDKLESRKARKVLSGSGDNR